MKPGTVDTRKANCYWRDFVAFVVVYKNDEWSRFQSEYVKHVERPQREKKTKELVDFCLSIIIQAIIVLRIFLNKNQFESWIELLNNIKRKELIRAPHIVVSVCSSMAKLRSLPTTRAPHRATWFSPKKSNWLAMRPKTRCSISTPTAFSMCRPKKWAPVTPIILLSKMIVAECRIRTSTACRALRTKSIVE